MNNLSDQNYRDLNHSVQVLAQHLHSLSGMHIGIHDIERMYSVSAGDECENLCHYCQKSCALFKQKCICSDEEHLSRLYRTRQKIIYCCHLGLTEVLLPVTVEEKFLGVLFLGQVRIIPDENMTFERVYARLSKEYPDVICEDTRNTLEKAYHNTAVITQEKLESLIGLAEFAGKGVHIDRWLNHFKLTSEVIVQQYLAYLDLAHLSLAEFSVSNIAERLNISYSQLNRISTALYGQPLKQYVLDVKIRVAAALLKEQPKLTIVEVSRRVGIDNPNYFSKLFQKRMGCRCSDYKADRVV